MAVPAPVLFQVLACWAHVGAVESDEFSGGDDAVEEFGAGAACAMETETTAAGPFQTSGPWPRCAQPQAGHRGTTRPPPPPPTDCGELVQAHDDRAVFRALREVLPVIDLRSL